MATDTDFIAYLTEQAGLGACDNSLFIKPSDAVTHLAANLPTAPPYPGAKDYPVADELLDDGDRLRELLLETAALMPEPKMKQAKDAKPAKPGKRR